jgi:hypothetical protein
VLKIEMDGLVVKKKYSKIWVKGKRQHEKKMDKKNKHFVIIKRNMKNVKGKKYFFLKNSGKKKESQSKQQKYLE